MARARSSETDATHLMFAGHTDVVPSGPPEEWNSPPFEPTIEDGMLYGRGAADMKSSLAAMIYAIDSFLEKHPNPLGTLSFLITSDEEGDAVYGTRHAIRELASRGIRPDYCVIGEPSSSKRLGDVVRCGGSGSKWQSHRQWRSRPRRLRVRSKPIHRAARPGPLTTKSGIQATTTTAFKPANLEYPSRHRRDQCSARRIDGFIQHRFNTEQREAGLRSRLKTF